MADHGEMKTTGAGLPPEFKNWTKDHVRKWALELDAVDDKAAEILFKEDINGPSLLLLNETHLKGIGVTFGPATLIIHSRDEMIKFKNEEPNSFSNQPGRPCKPYPFCRYHDPYRYIEGNILDITESGALDLIEPCHEYKAFTNTTDETKMDKFTWEVIRFAAACMNSRTNGTIHFGIGDKPEFAHGEVLGVVVQDKEAFGVKLKSAINKYFVYKPEKTAQVCIKPPRFVGVLNKNMTSSDKCVIEVDVVPDCKICGESYYSHTTLPAVVKKKKAKSKAMGKSETEPRKQFFIRDGGSSRDLLAPTTSAKPMVEYNNFVKRMEQLSQLRKQAEEKHLSVIKSSTQGSGLSQMITGGSHSLDKSHFECYVIVTNKSHSSQFESLGFLEELNPTAVLDFDPESAQHGLQRHFDQRSAVNPHLPAQYKITEGVENTAKKLKLTRNTSWVFCNGGIKDVPPSDIDRWLMEKGADTRDVISFLCRKDVLPNKRFLVTFLLLSTVSEKMDPLVETFCTFLQELKGTDQILCICDNERTFISWRDLIDARCGIDITPRCIYELSFPEVNGTILSLLSKNRRSIRFLPCGGGSHVRLEKKMEQSLNTLEILCVNQCEGGNEDRKVIEENFYKGGKVEWWNFYFSEQPGSLPFIKRDKFDFIVNTLIPDACSQRRLCGLLHLKHVPGCGGTTLAMHVLWTLREKYRCAVLKDSNADLAEVTDEVIKLLMYPQEEKSPQIPVLLMIDDFDDEEKVFNLQQLIEERRGKKIQVKSPQVIILNCMRSEFHKAIESGDTAFLENDLSDKEQILFDKKLVEMKKTHKDIKTFYGFRIMKENFSEHYVQRMVHDTLKAFDKSQKNAQLLAVLVLLDVYCRGAALSVSLCEELLGLQPKPLCGTSILEEGFGNFYTLISTCSTASRVRFQAVKMIHTRIARCCLKELETTHNVSKADIINFLLNTNQLYESTQGKDKFQQDVLHVLIKRDHSNTERSPFSPLITEIEQKNPEDVKKVLESASKRFEKDAFVCQLLARYYLSKQDFSEAKKWAAKARDLYKDNSYLADTLAQVIKHELKSAIPKNEEVFIDPEKLRMSLKLAQSAISAFKEVQRLAKKESLRRLQFKTDKSPYNTSGCLGEIQVGVLTIEVLQKTPVFCSSDPVRHDILSQVLSGKTLLQEVERHDKKQQPKLYYSILREFEEMLSNLRSVMKVNFDFFESFYGNLGSASGLKDSREQVTQNELQKSLEVYGALFCRTDLQELLKNQTKDMVLDKTRRFLEKHKADTYSGILSCLSNGISPEGMEQIVKMYRFIGQYDPNMTVKDKINSLYANIVLSRVKPESELVWKYQKLIGLLCKVLHEPASFSDNLSLHFVAVLLLWPDQQHTQEFTRVGTSISQIRNCYHMLFKEVYNGKRPIIHFFLGKKEGYERLVHLQDIEKCIKNTENDFTSLWRSGKIWKMEMVKELLCRVTGEVDRNLILADTSIPSVGLEVTPMFQGQLSGCAQGSKVSFFLGFSMRGPVALDID
ncbi:uncharacterized protein V6R79_017906 [Siganus canaliculatus]